MSNDMNEQMELDISFSQDETDINPYLKKERKLVTQPYDMSVATVIEQIANGDIILEPEYQRKYRWDTIKASRFIESLLLNIPIPTVFLAEEEDVTYSVIDGQQRLTTIRNFIVGEDTDEELILEGLQIRFELNGKKFSQLSKQDQGKLKKQYIRCIVILNDSDPQIKFDVFERLNSGSAHLTEQEIRNCIYRGSFNDLIKELASNDKFQKMLNLPEKDLKNMTDVEFVLRFLAYRQSFNEYNGSVKEFLNNFMKNNREITVEQRKIFAEIFTETVDTLYDVLGKDAFNRYLPDRNNWHGAINKAVFDAEMIAFSLFKFNTREIDTKKLRNRIVELMSDYKFIRTIASSTNSPEKVSQRVHLLSAVLTEFGGER